MEARPLQSFTVLRARGFFRQLPLYISLSCIKKLLNLRPFISGTQTTPAEIQMILTQPLRRSPNEAIVNRRTYHTLTMSLKTQGSVIESVDYLLVLCWVQF